METHGPPDHVTVDAEVFGDDVVLRKDKPEVLFLSEPMAPAFLEWLTTRGP